MSSYSLAGQDRYRRAGSVQDGFTGRLPCSRSQNISFSLATRFPSARQMPTHPASRIDELLPHRWAPAT
ncbi:MAG: hypothetical protein ACK5Y7_00520 [Betaproteobacteria bacterium]